MNSVTSAYEFSNIFSGTERIENELWRDRTYRALAVLEDQVKRPDKAEPMLRPADDRELRKRGVTDHIKSNKREAK